MNRRLILIRHGHRDTSQRSDDNGLTEKGQRQAAHLLRFFDLRLAEDPELSKVALLSSPKKRCLETLAPIAERLKKFTDVRSELDEQRPGERMESVDARIHKFIQTWTAKGADWTIVGSHGDIIPMMAFHLLGCSIDVKKGSWLEIEWQGEQGHLINYIRNFKFFF